MAIVTACATANNNIGEAWRMIKFGDADGFICGGAEAAILPMGYAGFGNMRALFLQIPVDRFAKADVRDPVQGVRRRREIAARQLVLALGARLDPR